MLVEKTRKNTGKKWGLFKKKQNEVQNQNFFLLLS